MSQLSLREIKALPTFGERMTAARHLAKLTQAELAEAAGVKISTVSRWERNVYEPKLIALEAITRELQARIPKFTSDILLGIS